jgi:NAD/NADP transhydrogenase beta subunit
MSGLASGAAFAMTIALTAAVLLLAPVGGAAIPVEVRIIDGAVALAAGAAAVSCLILFRGARHRRRRAR